VAKIQGDGVKPESSARIEMDLVIPQILMASNIRFCEVVQIYYFLEVKATFWGCRKSIEFMIPITIGAIPIGQNSQSVRCYVNSIQPTDRSTRIFPTTISTLSKFFRAWNA
jgi:hypothetical protein